MKYVKSRKETVVVHACSVVPDSFRPMDCSPLGSSVHGILRQEYWSELPFPSLVNLPDPGNEPRSLMSSEPADRLFSTARPEKWKETELWPITSPHPGPPWCVLWGWIPDAKDLSYIKIPAPKLAA